MLFSFFHAILAVVLRFIYENCILPRIPDPYDNPASDKGQIPLICPFFILFLEENLTFLFKNLGIYRKILYNCTYISTIFVFRGLSYENIFYKVF